MVCVGIENLNITGIGDFLSIPNSCDPLFWAKMLVAFFVILTFILYENDRRKLPKADWISAMGVSSIATLTLAIFGYLGEFIETFVLILIFVGTIILVALWMFKK